MLRSAILLLLLVVGITVSPFALSEPITIRFSHVVSERAPKGIGANLFKDLVKKRLGDRVRVVIYPRSSRFNDNEVLIALLLGDVELAAPSLSKFGNYSKALQVFDLPFLFPDVDAVKRFQASSTGQQLLESMEPIGIRGLAYWDNGMKSLSSQKPFRVPADLRGQRFRIQSSDVIEEQILALDAVPLKMPFSQAFEAMRFGIVDGQENAWSNIYTGGYYRVQKHFTNFNYAYLGYMVVTSTQFWDSLPNDIRNELEQILREVTLSVNKTARDQATKNRAELGKRGDIELLRLSDSELEMWKKAWQPLQEKFTSEIGEEIVRAARATARSQ